MITKNPNNLFLFTALILLLTVFVSCKKNPTGPVDSRPLISAAQYQDVDLALTNYDLVHVTHSAGLDLRSATVVRVEVGVKNSGLFVPLVSSPSSYDASAEAYVIHFDFTVRMDSSKINAPLTIRYITNDSAFHDVDTTVALYKYPYSSAQVFADSTTLQNGRFPIQGLSLSGSTLYYHPMDNGLYALDLNSRVSSLCWNGYTGGSHIAADSNFVFCDINHTQISRFSLTTNTAQTRLPDLGNINTIDGMAIQNHSLYVLVYGLTSVYLQQFSFEGVLLDSIPYPSFNSYIMTIYDTVAFCKDEVPVSGAYQISRFALGARTFLPNIISPAKEVEGIAISGGNLYYYDLWKNFIGVVPFADLKTVGTTS